MPENILVIEHEPRDADLVRQALAGQPFAPLFAADNVQALRAIDTGDPKLIILASGVIGAADIMRAVRSRPALRNTPVLLTVSEGTGTAELGKLGATDVLARPFTAMDLLARVRRLLAAGGQLTSNDIFGDMVDDNKSPQSGARKAMKPDDLDKLLADTLSDVIPQKGAKAKPGAPVPGLDKKLQDTLSGLEKSARSKTGPGTTARPATPATPSPVFEEKTHIAEPIFIPPPAAAIEEEPTDGVKFGQYVLLEKIASGGMAEVWKARMRGVEGFQKIVAIKKILPHLSDNQEFVEMFIDEAKLAAQLNHNNIIHIYDLGKIQSSYYIAMEFVDGNDLKTILRRADERDQPLSVELALFIASKIAAALDYAHRKRDYEDREMGLVHRDVSPQNVLISEEGDIKLCDFGIAKAATKASHTQAGALKGKLQYMSPEQAWGKAIDRRSDIFALAAVLFEMLTRKKLFTGDNEMSILEQVREAHIMPPSVINDEVSPEIDAIVMKGLQKDPADRYQTAAEMARDIDSLLYSFRPTPTNADVAIFMHRLRNAEPMYEATQMMDDLPIPPPPPAPAPAPPAVVTPPPPATVMPSWEAPRTQSSPITVPPPQKRSAALPIAIVALLAIAGAGAWFFMRGRSSAPATTVAQTQTSAAAPAAAAPPVTDTTMTIVDATATNTASTAGLTASTATTTTAPVIDAALVNEEVQRRIAAERARMEQQARATTPATTPQPQPVARPVTPQPVPPPRQQQPQPQPAVAETQPAPQPTPQPAVEPARPAPQPAAESVRVQEGDLVTDLSGLVPARMLRRADLPYPPLARMQRVEGRVLVSALVSETGQVLETRVIVPIKKPVGLNEAAQAIVKRSTFSPPTKDGVKVKAWTTVPIDFKL